MKIKALTLDKITAMGIVEMKKRIHEIVDGLDDSFLKVVHSMLDAYVQEKEEDPIVSYDIDGTPRTATELTQILDARVDEMRQGNYITIEELEKRSAQWRS